jgi:amidase
MSNRNRFAFLPPLILLFAMSPAFPQSQNPTSLTGRWIVNTDSHGTPILFMLTLKQDGEKLMGDFDGDKLEGTFKNNSVTFHAQDSEGGFENVQASLQGGTLTGKLEIAFDSDIAHPTTHDFTATFVPPRPTGPPQRHEFVPTIFYRQFSPNNKPVLTAAPGDTIHTTTVDAGGTDEKSVERVLGGNPETGPFYIQTAAPGDTLAVHIVRLKLNRDWAISDSFVVDRAVDPDLAVKLKDSGKSLRWHLDPEKGVATLEKPGDHTGNFSVPLHPMLGCIGVAPPPSNAPPGTGDSGSFGGNMDFNEISEGATVYLPVSVPGALLYVGDGHAVQGDGELNGNALETSMDVEITVDVIPSKSISGPRVENSTHIMAMGLAGSVDAAVREATSAMANWLADDYKLTPTEIAEVLGSSSEYRISELADRNAGVVLKLAKARLQTLTPPPAVTPQK